MKLEAEGAHVLGVLQVVGDADLLVVDDLEGEAVGAVQVSGAAGWA